MSTISNALKTAGKYVLSDHAMQRIRQRVGLTSVDSAAAWVKAEVSKAMNTEQHDHKTHYFTDAFEIICDGTKVVTVKPADSANEYVTRLGGVLAKEVDKLIEKYQRELRKADIAVAEAQLNYLKARNPKTKELISEKLTEAVDRKSAVEDEIKAIQYAGKRYGLEV